MGTTRGKGVSPFGALVPETCWLTVVAAPSDGGKLLARRLAFGLVVGLAFGLIEWMGTPSRTGKASTPRSTYKETRTLTVLQISLSGLVFGLAGGLAAISSGTWLSYVVATCWLKACGKLPLRLMDFLDDAYRLGLLRTVGPVYQFRHAEFQDHLIRTAGTRGATD